MKISKNTKAYCAIIIATIFWGTTYPIIKFGLSELQITPLSYLFMRFLTVIVVLCPLLWIKSIRMEVSQILLNPDIIIMGLLNGVAYSLQFKGQVSISAGIATIMVNTYVLFTPVFAHLLFRKSITDRKKIAITIGFLGTAVIALGDLIKSDIYAVTASGTLMVLGTGIFTGLYVVYSEKAMKKVTAGKQLNPISVFIASSVFTILIISITGFIMKDLPGYKPFPLIAVLPVIYLGVICTAGTFILYLIAVRELGSVDSAVFLLLQIIVSILLSLTFLKEVPDIFMVFGSLLIFLSIYLIRDTNRPGN